MRPILPRRRSWNILRTNVFTTERDLISLLASADQESRDGGLVKILLVEDSRPIRLENERALIQAGYQVICAEDGQRVLQLAGEQQPGLILLDLLLPKVSGLKVLEYLKSNPGTAQIPVVVLSSLSEKNREKLMAAGTEDYLEKNSLMANGQNLLPRVLEDVICRINRKRGIAFASVPTSH